MSTRDEAGRHLLCQAIELCVTGVCYPLDEGFLSFLVFHDIVLKASRIGLVNVFELDVCL